MIRAGHDERPRLRYRGSRLRGLRICTVTPRRSGVLCHCHFILPEEHKPGTNVLFCTGPAAWATGRTPDPRRPRLPPDEENAVRGLGAVPVDPWDAVAGLEVLEAAQRSAATGQVVALGPGTAMR